MKIIGCTQHTIYGIRSIFARWLRIWCQNRSSPSQSSAKRIPYITCEVKTIFFMCGCCYQSSPVFHIHQWNRRQIIFTPFMFMKICTFHQISSFFAFFETRNLVLFHCAAIRKNTWHTEIEFNKLCFLIVDLPRRLKVQILTYLGAMEAIFDYIFGQVKYGFLHFTPPWTW